MEVRNILKQYASSILIILLAVVMRLVPHPPNFAPIAALALFGGAHFDKKLRFIIPFSAMIISDLILGFDGATPYVYFSFFLIILVGSLLHKHQKLPHLVGASLTSSVLFFLITNFGVWAAGSMYTKDLSGLMNSYAMGIPFFKNTLLGDLFYTGAFFYGFSLVRHFNLVPVIASRRHVGRRED